MATLVPVPKLGQSEETVTIVKWRKAEGEAVKKGDVLFEVETDKAVLEVESQFAGTLLKIVVPAGQVVPVMSICAVIGNPGEPLPAIPAAPTPATPAAGSTAAPAKPPSIATIVKTATAMPSVAPAAAAVPVAVAPAPAPVSTAARRQAVSPRARKLAASYLIDLKAVPGSGPDGRVVEKDVQTYLEASGYRNRKITPAAFNLAKQLGFTLFEIKATGETGRITIEDVRRTDAERPKPMSKIRQVIARRLQHSKQTIPHFYTTVSIDMTDLLELRKELKKAGSSYSVTDFIVKATAAVLKEFPSVNSRTDDSVNVRWSSAVHIGLAVSLENGLVVPVIRNADKLTLDELHEVAIELADKARDGKLQPQEMQGGTFTISNMGMLNVENFSAIINPGESAILAVSSTMPAAVVNRERQIVVRDLMKVTLSADHRLVDGAMAAAFVNALKRRIENISAWKQELGQ